VLDKGKSGGGIVLTRKERMQPRGEIVISLKEGKKRLLRQMGPRKGKGRTVTHGTRAMFESAGGGG